MSPGYFPILRIPLAHGRIWDETENHNAAHVAVINQTMARLYFPNGDAIGHSLKVPEMKDEPPYTTSRPALTPLGYSIVGVVADKRDDGLRNPILPEVFLPYTIVDARVDANSGPLRRAAPVAAARGRSAGELCRRRPTNQWTSSGSRSLDHRPAGIRSKSQLVAWLFGAFAVLALALAAVGLYSVVSYSVAQRTNEFGIRMALGAQRAHVLRIVFASTVVSVGSGIVAGIGLTLVLNKLLAQWAEGSSRDPLVLLAVTFILCVVAAIACSGPARRALNVDPMTALRYE